MTTEQAYEVIEDACSALADAGDVDDAWSIRAAVDAIRGTPSWGEKAGDYRAIYRAVSDITSA